MEAYKNRGYGVEDHLVEFNEMVSISSGDESYNGVAGVERKTVNNTFVFPLVGVPTA